MDTADEKVARRSAVEAQYSGARDAIEKQYTADKVALEQQYLDDLATNREARVAALRTAGLNPDGSDPQERPQG